MKKGSTILLATFSLLLVFNASCGSRNNYSDIAGKWYYMEDPNISIEFFSDNSLRYNKSEKGLAGKWLFLEDGRLKVEIDNVSGSKTIGLGAINGNVLTLDYEGGKCIHCITKKYGRIFPIS